MSVIIIINLLTLTLLLNIYTCCYVFIADVLNVNSGCEKVTASHRIITEAEKPRCGAEKPPCGAEKPLCAPDKTVTSKEMSFSQTLTKFLSGAYLGIPTTLHVGC